MHRSLDMELIFPIRDAPSAQFMSLKAECLQSAGLISKSEERAVLGKAAKALTASNGKPSISRSNHTLVA